MSDRKSGDLLVGRVIALFPADWRGRAGERFRKTLSAVSAFARRHRLEPSDLVDESVGLGRRKIEGLANKELAAAARDFADAEQTKIETELKRRSLESKVRFEEATARLEEIRVLTAELSLMRQLSELKVLLRYDERGNLTVLQAPDGCDLTGVVERRLLDSSDDLSAAEGDPKSE
jgi:hypothetical protein